MAAWLAAHAPPREASLTSEALTGSIGSILSMAEETLMSEAAIGRRV
jgi:hypothetical protein